MGRDGTAHRSVKGNRNSKIQKQIQTMERKRMKEKRHMNAQNNEYIKIFCVSSAVERDFHKNIFVVLALFIHFALHHIYHLRQQ